MDNSWILAVSSEQADSQTTAVTQTPSDANSLTAPPPPKKPFDTSFFIMMGLMFVVFYFILFRGPQKKQQQHKTMIQALQKNDRILTVGGIYGTIVDFKDNEIIIKIDESNNTKIRISRNAVAENLSKGKEQ